MKIINVQQGSSDWHAHRAKHFNASEAAAMMGASPYMTRTELLALKSGGETKEVSSFQQTIFDRGHATEELARPLAEAFIGEELFPIVAVSDEHPRLAASYDGLTFDYETGFEHKQWNAELAEKVRTGVVADDPVYFWQLEHQMLVNPDLQRIVFTVSDGTADKCERFTYVRVPGRREQLIAGWAQFEADLAAYVPPVAKAAPVAAPVETLPAIVYQIDRGTLALTSNLDQFRAVAETLIERAKTPLVTDQDFADREAMCKAFGEAEKRIDMLCEQVVGELQDIAAFQRELGNIREMFRATRLSNEKLVDAEKKNRRNAIRQGGEQALAAHVASLQARFSGRATMPMIRGDFAGVIKGKRTLDSIQNAVDTELARCKIEANAVADVISANLTALDELAADHLFLFRDLQALVTMPAEAFRATVEGRVATHKAQEQAKVEAEAKRLLEEQQKAAQVAQQHVEPMTPAKQEAVAGQIDNMLTQRQQPAPAANQLDKTGGMKQYADLIKPFDADNASPGVTGMASTLARSYGVDFVTAIRWLQTINPADLAEALKTATEAQEA